MIRLFKHQEQALNKVKNFNNVAFYLDMGLGKTFVSSEKLKHFGNNNNLVICQNSKVDDWSEHFREFYTYEVFKIKSKSDVTKFMECKKPKIAIINYEKTYRDNFKALLNLTDFTLIIDESSVLGNPKTNIVKTVRKYKYKNLILLSGTPTSGKYEKLWTQLNLLGWDIKENKFYNQFLNRTLERRFGRVFYKLNKQNPYRNVDRLKRKMREYGCVFMKTEEAFDLPKQNFININCKPSKEYKVYEQDRIVKFNNTKIIGDTTLNYRLGLRQLCGIYSKDKLQRLKDLINSTDDRLIIFYNFNKELEEIKKIIKDRPLSYVNGSLVDKDNYYKYDNSITLMQYQAGAKGHNMQLANKLIFYSPTEKCEDYMQSMKRIHRIGQDNPCFYYKFIVKNSIEEDIYRALERGEDYTNELFNERKSI